MTELFSDILIITFIFKESIIYLEDAFGGNTQVASTDRIELEGPKCLHTKRGTLRLFCLEINKVNTKSTLYINI